MMRPFFAALALLAGTAVAFAQLPEQSAPTTDASQLTSGTLACTREPALTGDVTTSAGSCATTLATGSASNLNSGTLPAARLPALTGDVTSSAGSAATTVASSAVTNAKLANMASTTIKGQIVGGSGAPVDLTATQAAAVVGSVGGALKAKIVSTTRNMTTASGSQAVTGVGFQPSACIAAGSVSGSVNSINTTYLGMVDTGLTGVNLDMASAQTSLNTGRIFGIVDATTTNFQTAVVASLDADGLTLTWTKTGSPTGTLTMIFLCFR